MKTRYILHIAVFLMFVTSGYAQSFNAKDSTKKIQAEIKKLKTVYAQEVDRLEKSQLALSAWKQNEISLNKWKTATLDADFLDSLNSDIIVRLIQKNGMVDSVRRIQDTIQFTNRQKREISDDLVAYTSSKSDQKKKMQDLVDSISGLQQQIFDYKNNIAQTLSLTTAPELSIEGILADVKNANPYLKKVEQIFWTQYKEDLNKIDRLIRTDATKVSSAEANAAEKTLNKILGDYGFVPEDGILLEYSLKVQNLKKYTYFMDTARLYFSTSYKGSLRRRLIEIRASILDANTGGWLSPAATDTLNLYLTAVNGYCNLSNDLINDFFQKVPVIFATKRFSKENVEKEEIMGYLWVSPFLRKAVDDFYDKYTLSPSKMTIDQAIAKVAPREGCFEYLQK